MCDLCMQLLFHIFVKPFLGTDFVIILLTSLVLITSKIFP